MRPGFRHATRTGTMPLLLFLSGCATILSSGSPAEVSDLKSAARPPAIASTPEKELDRAAAREPVVGEADGFGSAETLEAIRTAHKVSLSVRDDEGNWFPFVHTPDDTRKAAKSVFGTPESFSKRPRRPRFLWPDIRYRFEQEQHTVDVLVNRETRAVEVQVDGDVVGHGALRGHGLIRDFLDYAQTAHRNPYIFCCMGECTRQTFDEWQRDWETQFGTHPGTHRSAGTTRLAE